jgi:spore maturation protein CgeB
VKFVIFGLTVSSSWGNGHATLWRGLWRALVRRGHRITFFERDVPYYAIHRDLTELPGGDLYLYTDWTETLPSIVRELASADVAMVTSYCPDAVAACDVTLSSPARARVFYDLDTPITLSQLVVGDRVPYLPPYGLGEFDLVLSFTGGRALDELRDRLGARAVAPLYGHVDPDVHRPVAPCGGMRADLSYLGTYAEDRQTALNTLFIEPARQRSQRRFLIAGAQYPNGFPWTENMYFVRHLPPREHAAFFARSRMTLNITRLPMIEMGYCPSGRLFEAAACGTPILTDWWEGLDSFYQPGQEVVCACTSADAIGAIESSDAELTRLGQAARERTLEQHTSDRRADELVTYLNEVSWRGRRDLAGSFP